MQDFLRQFLARISQSWFRLTSPQRIVLGGSAALALAGLLALAIWPAVSERAAQAESKSGWGTLFRNLDAPEAAQIVEGLKSAKVEYKLENNGRDILVPRQKLDEQRLAFAAQGLPRTGSVGWEIFDKTQLGLTDFVQNINYRRALEGEISRTIAALAPVENARVLISIPKPSLFTEKEQPPTASVVLKLKSGQELDRKSVKGISQLIASSVEGLKPQNVTILDAEGRVLNKGGGDSGAAASEANNELRGQVEAYLQNKVSDILDGVVGAGNHRVQVSADLDFESVEKTAETYDPQSKTVRSEQTEEETKEGSPTDGNDTRESRTANYEIDRTVVKSVSAPGSVRKRVTVSVAVDGHWEQPQPGKDGKIPKDAKPAWKPRSQDEVAQLNELVRNAIGAQAGNDNVFVTCVKFENPLVEAALADMGRTRPPWADWIRWAILGASILAGLLLLRGLVKVMQDAANPPRPAYADLLPPEFEETPEDEMIQEAVRVNDLLSRLENMTKAEPGNFSKLIRTWLQEGSAAAQERNGKKGR
jgi:flagellar M-ring protein FliF